MNTILENIQAVKAKFLAQTGFNGPSDLYLTGDQAEYMIRNGLLNPDDLSVRVWISANNLDKVRQACLDVGRQGTSLGLNDCSATDEADDPCVVEGS